MPEGFFTLFSFSDYFYKRKQPRVLNTDKDINIRFVKIFYYVYFSFYRHF
jgi:hypothetical protein